MAERAVPGETHDVRRLLPEPAATTAVSAVAAAVVSYCPVRTGGGTVRSGGGDG